MAVTMNSATFMGENFPDNQNSNLNKTDLTLKKVFDISAKLVGEQDEIFNVDAILWEKHSWKFLCLIGDETIIIFNARKSTSFQILWCVFRRSINIRSPTNLGKTG